MKQLKNILLFIFILAIAISCKKDEDDLSALNNVAAPANVTANFDITQDNSGLVTIIPNAEGATQYLVTFGDVADETPAKYGLNDEITHIYDQEGVYKVGITAVGITGLTSNYEQELNISFRPPENLVVTIEQDVVNPSMFSVSATADYTTIMDIYFGDVPDEEPVHAVPGEVVSHTYAAAGDYEIKVVAKNAGPGTIEYTETVTVTEASDPVYLPVDFESFTVNYAFIDFGNEQTTVIDNPDASGINTSARVAQSVKPAGAETWAGTVLTLGESIDFSTNKLFKMKVWSPKSGAIVKLKVENLDNGDIAYEVDAVTTVSNQWEELSFDFSGIDMSNTYQKLVFFFDFGNAGDDSTYYFDDVKLGPASVPDSKSVEDFEGEVPEFTVFGNIEDVVVVANPDQSGINTTANTARLTKTEGAETWAGAFFETSPVLDLDNFSKLTVKTWSPKSGIVVKLKLENEDESITHEVDVTNTVANGWEELVYDFSDAPAADYVRIVIFFDFGNPGDGSVYYYDEIELANEGGGGSPGQVFEDFEGEPPVFTDFGNAVSMVIENPDASGVNTTANVAEMLKAEGADTWAGSFFDLASPLNLADYKKISVMTWSPKVGAVVKLKLENSANGDEFFEVDLNTTVSNSWEELVYDFSAAPDYTYDRVVIFFDFGNAGDGTTYYYDEYTLTN